jgi:putative DNA primase/helicase
MWELDEIPELRHRRNAERSAAETVQSRARDGAADGGDALPPEFSDEDLALAFADRYAGEFRYVATWGRWFTWSGQVWRGDDTLLAFDAARSICREAAAQAKRLNSKSPHKIAAMLASAKTVAATERLAKADRRLAATVNQWDADPWTLNTPAGLVDLRSGRLSSSRPEAYASKMTAAAPAGDCPIWHAALNRAFAGDSELLAFFQRVAGYGLTGVTSEHAMFFSHGGGANGKGATHNTLTGMLGDYAVVAPMETFTATGGDRHPADLAMLRGARLVTAQETEEGRRWAEQKIKALTGGDPITARYMRQDFFTFTPQFKLLIAGNHKPGLRGVDEAIRRRMHLIPFNVTIPVEESDPNLPEKLKAEWPGILAWAIEGCLQWQRVGLAPPAAVRDATAKYLDAEDAFSLWLEERCQVDPNGWESSTALFGSWKAWAEKAGEYVGAQKRFVQTLEAKGLTPKRNSTGNRGFLGLRLKVEEQPESYWSR